jgi:hypothetical protein
MLCFLELGCGPLPNLSFGGLWLCRPTASGKASELNSWRPIFFEIFGVPGHRFDFAGDIGRHGSFGACGVLAPV